MNTSRDEARALAQAIVSRLGALSDVEVVVCPPFPWLTEVARTIEGTGIRLGAQNMHPEVGGAYTGEVSARMLKDLCQYVLIGQYERRIYFAEKDALVRRKLQAALQHGLQPILCVGENADQLDAGLGPVVVAEQLESSLDGVMVEARLVIAYDPVWTTMGLVTPPPLSYVGDMMANVRETLARLFSRAVAEDARLIYGGPVSPRNSASLAATQRVDGALVGSSSINADNFATVVKAFSQTLWRAAPPPR